MFRTAFSTALTFAFLAVATFGHAQQAEFRTWTDVKGRRIEAALVGAEGNTATLKKRNGNVYAVELQSLSEQDREFIKKRPQQETPEQRNPPGTTTLKHVRNVLALKVGERLYEPGTTFRIEPILDEVITGNCRLKFKCFRKTGESEISYGLCSAILAKVESGAEETILTRQYNAKAGRDGSISIEPTFPWPAIQRESQVELSVSFGNSDLSSRKLHGKGKVFVFLDDGKDTPLSNILAMEADVP